MSSCVINVIYIVLVDYFKSYSSKFNNSTNGEQLVEFLPPSMTTYSVVGGIPFQCHPPSSFQHNKVQLKEQG